jgi:uncharacterized protein (TIGR03437 family)
MLFSMLKLAARVQGELARTNGLPHEHTSSTGRRAMIARSCVLLTLACALAGSANAQFVQQGGKLLGTGEVGNAELGNSVAVSSDGNTAIVGGPGDNGNAGAAWVYTRSGGVWTQQGGKLVGSGAVGGAYQGWSVALSGDGNTAIVGGPSGNVANFATGVGAAWVYTRSGGVWTQQGSKLAAADAVGNAGQGTSVALSSDGNTAVVGGFYDNGGAGAVWVYTRSGGVWTQQGGKLVGTGAVGGAYQGYSVALSSDGNSVIVGGPLDNGDIAAAVGAVWVYTRSGGVWTQQGGKLVASGAVGDESALQGLSVALSSDGNTALVGGPGDNYAAGAGALGAAWVYTRSGGVWTQQGGKLVGSGAVGSDVSQGFSAALSADGNTAIVGGPDDNGGFNGAGAAWVFTRSGGVWTQQGSKLFGTGGVGHASQGTSVALSGDGKTAIVGGPTDNGAYPIGAGAVWVFAVNTVPTAPQINAGGIVNNASYGLASSVAPGSIAALFGTNLTNGTSCLPPACNPAFGSDGKLGTTMAGAQVTLNGTPVPIFYAVSGQLGIQIPFEVTGTSATVSVSVAGQASTPATATLASVSPGIFTATADGKGAGAITHVDGSAVTTQNPAHAGEVVILYATGLGQVTPAVATGALPAVTSYTFAQVTLTIGGITFSPDFAGLSGCCVGLNQINARVPFGVSSGNAVPVVLNIGGKSSNTATIAVQ